MSSFDYVRLYVDNIFFKKLYGFWLNYISPANFNYLWNFGSISLICLFLQIITGIFLAMHYKADINLAFASIEYISRNVQFGWLIRYMHANGASIFFLFVYLHMMRNIIFGSFNYPRQILWGSGVIIYIIMIATAFFGYVLPWGQMSFWAATVITSLFSAIPFIGIDIVYWLWGGFSVDDATLTRFFSLHYFLPFIILILSIIHMMFLHEYGSNNPLGLFVKYDYLLMGPYYIVKDLSGLNLVFILFFYFVFFSPNFLNHSDNYMIGNSLITPTHIVPEWYFLPLYAVLRSVPDKLLGVCLLAVALIVLLFLPFFVSKLNLVRSLWFKPLLKYFIFIFFINCLFLGWIGGQPVIQPYFFIGQLSTIVYFFMYILFSFSSFFEQVLNKYYNLL